MKRSIFFCVLVFGFVVSIFGQNNSNDLTEAMLSYDSSIRINLTRGGGALLFRDWDDNVDSNGNIIYYFVQFNLVNDEPQYYQTGYIITFRVNLPERGPVFQIKSPVQYTTLIERIKPVEVGVFGITGYEETIAGNKLRTILIEFNNDFAKTVFEDDFNL